MGILPFSKQPIVAIIAVITFAFCCSCSFAGTDRDSTSPGSMARIKRFSEKIDSLEVEKQVKKRNGLPIAELEEKTTAFQDSIKSIRTQLGPTNQSSAPTAPDDSGTLKEYLKKLLPVQDRTNGFLDRILLAAGGITIIIGIFFLFILLSLKMRRKKKTPAHGETKRVAGRYQDAQRNVVPAQNAYPDSFTNAKAPPVAAVPVKTPATFSDKPIPPASPASETPHPIAASGVNLKDLVIKAQNDGMKAKDISRRFHIGIDQVALILKMAKKNSASPQ